MGILAAMVLLAVFLESVRSTRVLARERELPRQRLLGFSGKWMDHGRASRAFYFLGMPLFAYAHNHSTLWLD